MPDQSLDRFQKKCVEFFNEANGGEPVTPGQLCRIIRNACPKFQGTDDEIAEMFFDVDTNSDKLISWEEFSEAIFAKSPTEVTRSELEEQFEEIDKDGSGKLSRDEIRALVKSLGIDITDDVLDSIMEKADPDGNGVDLNEFLTNFKTK